METMEPAESTSATDDSRRIGLDGIEPDALEPEPDDSEDVDRTIDTEPAAPPVVAVVVTTGQGPYLDVALASLAAQDYPALSVLVVDAASDTDTASRIAAQLPSAYVRRLPENVGFAAAANEALGSVEGATFLLFCHDDIALDPDAVRVMVEETYRSNAGIVGPKLVDYDDPDVLLEVGMAIDHYGVPFSGIEPGEIDQEQHDGVRDVFFVSHAAMLVRADLFRELGGFDVATSPGSDDIDLCWRARLAGARVLTAPGGRARHRQAAALDERRVRRQTPRAVRAATRARVRVLCKAYSGLALVWVLPSAFVLTVAESLGLVVTRRARQAAAELAGWFPSPGSFGELRRARSATQRLREVDDADVRHLMIRGSARFRTLLLQRLHAGDRITSVSNRARARMTATRERVRRAPAMLMLAVAVLLAFGSRAFILQRVPEVGDFRAWPGIGDLWHTFTSPWRATMLGARTPASPVFAMMTALSSVLIGHGALARTLVVAGAMPVGVWGAFRLGRTLTAAGLPAIVVATAYAVNPVGRDAVARGELGPLVLFAFAPYALHALVRANRPTPEARALTWRKQVHALIVFGVLGAVAGAVWPPAALLGALIAAAFVVAALLSGAFRDSLEMAALALGGAVLSCALLLPWSASLLGADAATLGLSPRAPLSLGQVLRFEVGPERAGWYTLGLVVAAAVPLAVASGARFVWATRAWLLVAGSVALAWLPGRLAPTRPVPSAAGVLVPAALGLALAAGIGAVALLEDMRRSHFGVRQLAAVAAAVGLVLPLLAFAVDSGSGRWGLPSTDWPGAVQWMHDNTGTGGFRVLWVGDPSVLPADSKLVGGIGFTLTRDGAGDARALWAAPQSRADTLVGEAVVTASLGRTARLGHLLAPAAVRYVAVLSRPGPGHGGVVPPPANLADALARQLDLSVSRIVDGGVIYSNDAWLPHLAVVPPGTPVDANGTSPLVSAAQSDASSVARGIAASGHGSKPVGPGTLLLSEAANPGWHARAAGRDLSRWSAFGWTNALALPAPAAVGVGFRAGTTTGALLDAQLISWAVVLIAWRRTRGGARRRGTAS